MANVRLSPNEGFHHVIMKGIDSSDIFHNDEDKDVFLSTLHRFSEKLDIRIVSFALLDNHVHFLAQINGSFPLGELVKRICTSYTQHYFNPLYDRSGPLFHSKYYSRPIKDDYDLKTVVKYILYNPIKAGLSSCLNFKYSSYSQHISDLMKFSIDRHDVLRRLFLTRRSFVNFMDLPNDDYYEESLRLREREIKNELFKKQNGSHVNFKDMDASLLSAALKKLNCENVSIARLSRITGISRYEISLMCA